MMVDAMETFESEASTRRWIRVDPRDMERLKEPAQEILRDVKARSVNGPMDAEKVFAEKLFFALKDLAESENKDKGALRRVILSLVPENVRESVHEKEDDEAKRTLSWMNFSEPVDAERISAKEVSSGNVRSRPGRDLGGGQER